MAGHMEDLDMVRDSLETLKHMTDQYNNAATECTNPGVRDFFQQLHSQEMHSANICFSFVHTRGAYPVEMAGRGRVDELRQRYQALAAALPADTGRPDVPNRETTGAHQTPAARAGISDPRQQGGIQH